MIDKFLVHLDNLRSLQLFQIMRYGSNILIGVLLAKSAWSLEAIGIYETLIFIGAGASFFWVSGFLRGLLPTFPGLSRDDKKVFLFNLFLLFCIASLVTTLLLFVLKEPVRLLLTDKDELPYYHLLCIYLLFNTPTFLTEYLYLLTEQPKKILYFGIVVFLLQILAVVIPVYSGLSLKEVFMALILLAFSKLLYLMVELSRHARFKVQFRILDSFLLLSIPLVLNMLVAGGAEYIDGVIVQRFFDKETFAIFRYGAKELPLALALSTAFSAALIPVIAKNLDQGLKEIRNRSRNLMHLLFSISIVLMLVSPYLFPIIFNPEFQESAYIFNVYLLILTSRVLFPQTVIIGQKRTRIILWVSIIELIVNITLSLILVRYIGLMGIAAGSVIAYALDKILLILYTRFRLGVSLNRYLDIQMYCVYCVLLFISFFLSFSFHQ